MKGDEYQIPKKGKMRLFDVSKIPRKTYVGFVHQSDAGRYMCIKSTGTKTYSRTYVQIKVFG